MVGWLRGALLALAVLLPGAALAQCPTSGPLLIQQNLAEIFCKGPSAQAAALTALGGVGIGTLASPPPIGNTVPNSGAFSTLVLGAATGGTQGAGTINATGFYLNGTPFTGGGSPGGPNQAVQFNNTTFAGDSSFTFNPSTKVVGVNALNIQGVNGLTFPTGGAHVSSMIAMGDGALASASSLTDQAIAIGYHAANVLGSSVPGGRSATGSIMIGYNAGAAYLNNQSGLAPAIIIGPGAMQVNTGEGDMIAIGSNALHACITGCVESVAIGNSAQASNPGTNNLGGGFNTSVGVSNLIFVTNGSNNTTMGNDVVRNATTSNFVTGYGAGAFHNGIAMSSYVGVGANAAANYGLDGNAGRTASDIALGNNAMSGPAAGSGNTDCGSSSGACNTNSAAVGSSAGLTVTTASYLTLLGDFAAKVKTTGSGDTIIGAEAAPTNDTTGGNNILLCTGNIASCDVPSAGAANTLGIWGGATAVMTCTAINATPICNFPAGLNVGGVPVLAGTLQGNTTVINTASGTYTSGHLVQIDSNGNLVDSGATAGAGTGIGTVNNGLLNNLAYYAAGGTAVSPLSTANSGVLNTSASGVPSIATSPVVSGTMTAAVFNASGAAAYEIAGANAISYPASDSTAGATIAVGLGALANINGTSAAYQTVALGYGTLAGTMTIAAVNNAAGGYGALASLTSGSGDTAWGHGACNAVTAGNGNICIGSGAGQGIIGNSGNVAIGVSTLFFGTGGPGNNNTAVGSNALFVVFSSADNVGVGHEAGQYISTGATNTSVGAYSMQGLTGVRVTGNSNSVFGAMGGLVLQGAAANNTFVGANTGPTNATTTTNSILLCTGAASCDVPSAGASNYFGIFGGATAIISATSIDSTPAVSIPGTLTLAGLPTSCSGIGGSKQIAAVAGVLTQC